MTYILRKYPKIMFAMIALLLSGAVDSANAQQDMKTQAALGCIANYEFMRDPGVPRYFDDKSLFSKAKKEEYRKNAGFWNDWVRKHTGAQQSQIDPIVAQTKENAYRALQQSARRDRETLARFRQGVLGGLNQCAAYRKQLDKSKAKGKEPVIPKLSAAEAEIAERCYVRLTVKSQMDRNAEAILGVLTDMAGNSAEVKKSRSKAAEKEKRNARVLKFMLEKQQPPRKPPFPKAEQAKADYEQLLDDMLDNAQQINAYYIGKKEPPAELKRKADAYKKQEQAARKQIDDEQAQCQRWVDGILKSVIKQEK